MTQWHWSPNHKFADTSCKLSFLVLLNVLKHVSAVLPLSSFLHFNIMTFSAIFYTYLVENGFVPALKIWHLLIFWFLFTFCTSKCHWKWFLLCFFLLSSLQLFHSHISQITALWHFKSINKFACIKLSIHLLYLYVY